MPNLQQFPLAKGQFPIKENIHYLNHAAVSPWPKCAEQALSEFAKENVLQGATEYPKWLKKERDLREKLRRLINASSTQEIALAKNTSEALSIIAYGIDWQAGDEVIITNHEFPSNRIVWESLQKSGVVVRVAALDKENPEKSVINLITNHTRLVSVSSVQYASGIALDLEQISKACKDVNALFCVDAIQSLGALPFDQQVIDADFIVADGHKWMMAAEGLALLYVKQSIQDSITLKQFGWHMVEARGNYDEQTWQTAKDATRFECGSPNMLGIHVLDSSLGLLLELGIANIHTAILERIKRLEDELTNIKGLRFLSPTLADVKPEFRSGIVTFELSGKDHKSLHQTLMQQKIICANRGGGIRLSPHFYTTEACIVGAVEAIEKLIQKG